jgi:hypothetical protein
VDADHRVRAEFATPRIRMAKALHSAGYSPAEIATVIHPFARGAERTKARLAVAKRVALREDMIIADVHVRADASDAANRMADLERAARFVAGGGAEGMLAFVAAPTESVVAEELPIDKGPTHRARSEGRRPRRAKAATSKR